MSRPEEWIVGGRWDQNDWAESKFLVHELSSRVSSHNSVFLMRTDSNAAIINSQGMRITGICQNRNGQR